MNSFDVEGSPDFIPASPDGSGSNNLIDTTPVIRRHRQIGHSRRVQSYNISNEFVTIPDSDEEDDSSKRMPPNSENSNKNITSSFENSIIITGTSERDFIDSDSPQSIKKSYEDGIVGTCKPSLIASTPTIIPFSTPESRRRYSNQTVHSDGGSPIILPSQIKKSGVIDSDGESPFSSRPSISKLRNSFSHIKSLSLNSSIDFDDSEAKEKKISRQRRAIGIIYSDDEENDVSSISAADHKIVSQKSSLLEVSKEKLYNGKYKIKSRNTSIVENNCSDSESSSNISTSSIPSFKSFNASGMSLDEIENSLKMNKMLLKNTNISRLPDNGEKIKNKINDLEEALSILSIENSSDTSSNKNTTDPSLDISSASSNSSSDNSSIGDISYTNHKIDKNIHSPIQGIKSNSLEPSSPEVKIISEYGRPPIRGLDLDMLKEELLEKQNTYLTINPRSLPDGGARLQDEISTLQGKIMMAELKEKIGGIQEPNPLQPTTVLESERPTYQQTRFNGNELQFAAVAQAIDSSKNQLPQHILEALYDAPKELGGREYGGKLSQARERDMVRVTAGAVEDLHKILKSMPDIEKEEESQPEGIKVELMIHQRRALRWLLWRETQNPPGGILADDMGLGKTLTMLALILKHRELVDQGKKADDYETLGERGKQSDDDDDGWFQKGTKSCRNATPSRGTLIVCPASLLGQWEGEVKSRLSKKKISTLIYHGTNRDMSLYRLSQCDLVVTTYQIVMREAFSSKSKGIKKCQDDVPEIDAQKQGNLFQIGWTRIILDESHVVRNHKSQTSQAVCMLRGGRRWAVTGTPVQNKEMDLYSIVRFLRVDPFENYTCWKHQVNNQSAHGMMKLNLLVRTLMLRRTKDQIDQSTGETLVKLPPKEVVHHTLNLTQEERQVYDRVFAFSKSSLINYMKSQEEKDNEKLSRNGNVPSKSAAAVIDETAYERYMPTIQCDILKTTDLKAHHMLVLLLRLRQICCHPALIRGIIENETKATDGLPTDNLPKEELDLDLITQMNEMNLKDGPTSEDIDNRVKDDILTADNPIFKKKFPSSKIEKIISEIELIKKKDTLEKAVVVSQWSSMLEIVYKHLKKRGIKTTAITGQIPVKDRGKIVHEFNNDADGPQVLLLSLAAGGVGLNLVGANHLFLIDMHWNPQLEAQACDRIYRVGQKKSVTIHRFVVENTVEEKILEMQKKKLDLANQVLSGAKRSSGDNKLTLQDIKSLFGIE